MSDKPMNEFNHLPEAIRHTRQLKGLSQENMAAELGISTTAYGDIERGKTEITLTRLSAIAGILDVPASGLLGIGRESAAESEWLKEENRRLLRENTELAFRNEKLESRLRALLSPDKERKRIGF